MKHTRPIIDPFQVVEGSPHKYKDTFTAFCELLNNSLQARATQIDLRIEYVSTSAYKAPLMKIELTDNGTGVAASEFEDKILLIGTDVKRTDRVSGDSEPCRSAKK